MNYRMIKNILGWILIFEAAFMTLPLLTAAIYKEKVFFSFLISIGICLLIGFLLVCRKPKDRTLYSREGFIIVALSWIALSMFGALPFCSAIAKIHVADTNETIEHSFVFRLSDLEIETLNKNVEFVKFVIDYEFIDSTQQITGSWLWAKPTII